FGFGGINAHVVLEEWLPQQTEETGIALGDAPEDKADPPPVAVVGADAWYGPWDTLRKFQEYVLGGGESHAPASPQHWWGAAQSAWYRREELLQR
ncbi:MAG: hypothetical protein GWN84_12670, partial [Gammaproteobacteria bacterium]|nr:hypothetical protein [Gammaproteobacteria bacterium]NIR83745.1 hypothetical protein [Gammaproteobacteria bacterium]NIU05048.1 hypothetical protein [Gammaproteobacteria bacterium]NIV77083.1 hypothetical protein [Gammaproteobacteria bacterium]NIX86321.1 hypothetical protein [Gammaproteobacteria bacterium]